jgi:hypothetical protein
VKQFVHEDAWKFSTRAVEGDAALAEKRGAVSGTVAVAKPTDETNRNGITFERRQATQNGGDAAIEAPQATRASDCSVRATSAE